MGRADKQVIIILTIIVIGYAAVWITGVAKHKSAQYLAVLNVCSSLALLVFWLQQELRVSKHVIEGYEIALCCFEILVAAVAVYYLLSAHRRAWTKIFQYAVFVIHGIAAVLFLVFMLTFKINRLF